MGEIMILDSALTPPDNGGMSTEGESAELHRSGFVAVVGRPNVGKSTLINAYLGQSIAAVSPKPQTTQVRQLGILTLPNAQVIFVDTPGIHAPHHRLGELMDQAATDIVLDADLTLVLFDLTGAPESDDRRVAGRLRELQEAPPVLIALNKADDVSKTKLAERGEAFESLLPEAELALPISALRGDNRQALLREIIQRLPEGPRYYPEPTLTDRYERDIAADFIRAAAMDLLHHEVPHSIAVRIDEFDERGDQGAYIAATLFVERESQKGIVIGKGGSMIKDIGTHARRGIEAMSGRNVYLDLRVKVYKNWRSDEAALSRLGYLADGSQR